MSAPLPVPPLPMPESVPATLRDTPRWVCWRFRWKVKPDGSRKLDKPPVHPADGYTIDAHDPANWLTFDAALAAARASRGRFGVGIVLDGSDGLVGADSDACIDLATGEMTAETLGLIADFDSYAEVSPSGRGVRIFALATLPGDGAKRGGLELYQRGRYLTVTGQRLDKAPRDVRPAQEAGARLWQRLAPAPKEPKPARERPPVARTSTLDAEMVINAIRGSRQGPKFDRLMAGDTSEHGGDHSSADQALCNILVGWCDGAGLMDAIFRRSGLFRDKWDAKRGQETYGERTIRQALDYVDWRYDWHAPGTSTDEQADPGTDGAQGDMSDCPDTYLEQITYWRERAVRAERERDEAKATIRAMRSALRNHNLGAARVAATALVLQVCGTPDSYVTQDVDEETGEVSDRVIPLRDERGFTRVYLGNGSEGEDGKPTRGLAADIGATTNTAARQVNSLRDAGLIEIDERRRRGFRDDKGNIRQELWVRFKRPEAADESQSSRVSELLTIVAAATRPPEAPRHGDSARFKSVRVPKTCPHCGSEHVEVVCGDCKQSLIAAPAPSPQDGETEEVYHSTVITTSLHPQDGDSGKRLIDDTRESWNTTLRRQRERLQANTAPPLCAAGCGRLAEYDNGADGYNCRDHALTKRGTYSKPLRTDPLEIGRAS